MHKFASFPYSLNDHTMKRDRYWPVWGWSMIECQTMTKRFRLSSIVLNYSHLKIRSITIDLKMANEKFTTFNYFWPLDEWSTDPPLYAVLRLFQRWKVSGNPFLYITGKSFMHSSRFKECRLTVWKSAILIQTESIIDI